MLSERKLTAVQQFRLLSLIVTTGFVLSIAAHSITLWLGFDVSASLVKKINFLNPINWVKLAVLCTAEEIIFRGILSLDVKAVCISIFSWFILLFSFLTEAIFKTGAIEGHHIYSLCFCVLLSIGATYITYTRYIPSIISICKSNYNLLFWTLCILFALAHLNNYADAGGITLPCLILVVPQLFMGSFLAVARIRNGIATSAIIHFFADTWFFLFGLESSIHEHNYKFIIVVLLAILLLGSLQIRLFRDVAHTLMRPSALVLGTR